MSDPATEAVRRAVRNDAWGSTAESMRAAACEALAPIRRLYEELSQIAGPGGLDVLAELAPLIFTSEELER